MTTLEHVAAENILQIFVEARRVLARGGSAVHLIDPSDHFEHQDHTITRINVPRFSESTWSLLAGNQSACCNRLRRSDYLDLFHQAGWVVHAEESAVDEWSLAVLEEGFPLDSRFQRYDPEDIWAMPLRVVLAPGG